MKTVKTVLERLNEISTGGSLKDPKLWEEMKARYFAKKAARIAREKAATDANSK